MLALAGNHMEAIIIIALFLRFALFFVIALPLISTLRVCDFLLLNDNAFHGFVHFAECLVFPVVSMLYLGIQCQKCGGYVAYALGVFFHQTELTREHLSQIVLHVFLRCLIGYLTLPYS